MAAARLGRSLKDKWILEAVIGIGGMAVVYEATHRNGNRVAVKILHPDFSAHEVILERFFREGQLANRVDHPDVVRVLDEDVDDDGSVFLVMELLEGESVYSRWAGSNYRLPLAEALWIVDRVLSVLEAAHRKEIIHRDIKPENLFLTSSGRLKLLDFGIARWEERGGSRTLPGVLMGTPGFVPPEQARGDWGALDHRADLWAVGATLFALLTGECVEEERLLEPNLARISGFAAPSVSSSGPTVPVPVARLIDRALAFDPKNRFQSATEMRSALRVAYLLATGDELAEDALRPTPDPAMRVRAMPSSMPSPGPPSSVGPVLLTLSSSPLAPHTGRWGQAAIAVLACVALTGMGALHYAVAPERHLDADLQRTDASAQSHPADESAGAAPDGWSVTSSVVAPAIVELEPSPMVAPRLPAPLPRSTRSRPAHEAPASRAVRMDELGFVHDRR